MSNLTKICFISFLKYRPLDWSSANCVIFYAQFGFKPGFDTKGAIFAPQGMISHHINKIQKLHCCSIDYKRAFDTHCR